jgi:hypothetical protein
MKGPPMMGKLNLGALATAKQEDEEMKEIPTSQIEVAPPKKPGFSLDINKAQKNK